MTSLPALIPAIPLLVAAALAGAGTGLHRRVIEGISNLVCVTTLAISLILLRMSAQAPIPYWFGGWQPRQGIALGISFYVDPLSAGLCAFISLLMLCSLIYSLRYFHVIKGLFHSLMLIFLAAMCGLALSGDLFNLFVWFELMSAAAIALCGYKIEELGPLQGAINLAITNTVGAFLSLSGIALLYSRTGALNLAQVAQALSSQGPDQLVVVAFLFFATGFLVKAAVLPFHFWLADAHAVAPTPVSVLFSGVMVELGLYAVARVYWVAFSGPLAFHADTLRAVFLVMGASTTVIGGLMCFLQRHIKRLLAFSTISHVGIMTCAFALLDPKATAGLALYLLSHGALKGSLFMGTGILLHRLGSVDELNLHGLGHRLRWAFWIFLLGALGLASLPPFSSLIAESWMDSSAHQIGVSWLPYVFMTGGALTSGAVLRVTARVFLGWGPPPFPGTAEPPEGPAQGEEMRETHHFLGPTPLVMLIPAFLLLAFALTVAWIPGFPESLQFQSTELHHGTAYVSRVLGNIPLPHESLGVVRVASHEVTRAALHACVSVFLGIILALWGLRYGREMRSSPRWCARAMCRISSRLHAVHSGRIGDYLAWMTFGVAVYGCWLVFRGR